jgi:PadR family transcriptional regulator PadR
MPSSWLSLVAVTTSHDPQLLKGVLSMVLLHLLAEKESYGYEVAQRLQAAGFADVLEGTVYPALTRLEREGRLATRLVPSPSGPARKYYRLTPAGLDALHAARAAWARHVTGVDAILARPLPDSPEKGP